MRRRKITYSIAALLVLVIVGGVAYLLLFNDVEGGSRQLRLSDFDFLKRGISRDEVVRKVGEPDRIVGSGLYICQYDLVDGRKIMLSFPTPEGLGGAWIVNDDGTRIDFFKQHD